jgi:hypothetical protein
VPRNTRKQLVGKVEDAERREREQRYATLEIELHCRCPFHTNKALTVTPP